MYQVLASSSHKYHISFFSDVYCNDADDSRSLKLIYLWKDDRCYIRKKHKNVLKRCLHDEKSVSTLLIHLLLYNALSAKIKTSQIYTTQYDDVDELARCEEVILNETFIIDKESEQFLDKSYHLSCQKSDIILHSVDVLLCFESDLCCEEFENDANRVSDTHSKERIVNDEKKDDHLIKEEEKHKVEQRQEDWRKKC